MRLRHRVWRWSGRESDRGVGPSRPGNSGGGKAPDFWRAFEGDEDRVIGDEPHNAQSVRSRRRKLYCKAKADAPAGHAGQRIPAVGLATKPVGKPDAGNPHVRLCVQRRLACSAGERPAGARVRSPVVWIAGWRETKTSEAYRQRLPWEDDESPGRNDSERGCGLESEWIRGPSPQP